MAETHTTEGTGFTISSSVCRHHFGFLNERIKGTAIPEECLTCEKMLDCITSKPETEAVQVETKPELEVVAKAEESIVVVEEIEETFADEKPKIIPQRVEKKAEPTPKPHLHPRIEPIKRVEPEKQVVKPPVYHEKPAEKPVMKRSDDDFCVESPGILYNQWTGTVLISKETLQSWGKKVKEVELQTHKGKKITCKVYASPDLAPRVIQVPSKIKADLEIDNGVYVRVKPATTENH